MLKAVSPDKKLMILGLSDENVARLKNNDPILVDAAQLGMGDFKIMIIQGPTEVSMRKSLLEAGININHETIDIKLFRGPQTEKTQ